MKKFYNYKKNSRLYWQIIVLIAIYGAYSILNFLRTTIIITSPAILEDPSVNLNKTMWGYILGWGTAGTLVGKLTTGVMADKFGGRRVFLCAIILCMLTTGIFGMVSEYIFFSVTFFIAMLAKSAGWPSMANLIKDWYPKTWRGRVWGILSSSSMSSSFFTSLLMSSILLIASWRVTIYTSLPITVIFLIFLYFYLKQSPADTEISCKNINTSEIKIKNPGENHFLENSSVKEAIIIFLRSYRFWLISISIMCLTILMSFHGFIPIFLNDNFEVSAGQASLASSTFPLGSMFSVLIGGFVYDKLSKKTRVFALGFVMVLASACVFILLLLIKFNKNDYDGFLIALLVIGVYGLMVAPCYLIPMSVFSLDFGGKHCGLLVGIIDAVGYLASMIFEFYGGSIADEIDGWIQFLNIIFNASILGTISIILFLFIDYRVYIKRSI